MAVTKTVLLAAMISMATSYSIYLDSYRISGVFSSAGHLITNPFCEDSFCEISLVMLEIGFMRLL